MTNKWALRGEGTELDISVVSYERTAADNQSDANWLHCKVTGVFGAFRCSGEYSMMTSEFVEFEDAVRSGIEGRSTKVCFSTMEEGLGWDIEFNGRGQTTVSGFVKSTGNPKATLSSSFQSDQSYLQQTLSELIAVNRQFPIRTLTRKRLGAE
jgi:hypothetical protein